MKTTITILSLFIIAATASPLLGQTITDKKTIATPTKGHWTQTLADPALTMFIEEGMAHNLDIQIATERVKNADYLQKSAKSAFMPDLSGVLSGTRGNTTYGRTGTLSKAGIDASWTPDIFGQIQAKIDGNDAQILAANAFLDQTKSNTIATITDTMVTWRQTQAQITQIQVLIKAQDRLVNLLKSRAAAGLIDASVLSQAMAKRNEIAHQLPQTEALAKKAAYHLSALLNRRDDSLVTTLASLPTLQPQLPEPADVLNQSIAQLENRPDLRLAEAALGMAKASSRQSKAALWPTVSLAAFFGIQDATDGLPIGDNPAWSVGANMSVPIFNFGRLSNGIEASNSAEKEALLLYEKTLTQAIQETKTALSDYINTHQAIGIQKQAITEYTNTLTLSQDKFKNGLTDMTPVSMAESELAQAEIVLIRLKHDALTAYSRLETAFGL